MIISGETEQVTVVVIIVQTTEIRAQGELIVVSVAFPGAFGTHVDGRNVVVIEVPALCLVVCPFNLYLRETGQGL